jgi:hypothetical protein
MGQSWTRPALESGAWYHGSPERLEVLREGSTVTRCRPIAEAFSHRPSCVGIGESDRGVDVCHNGTALGYLYTVEEVQEEDVRPHPNSAFPGGGMEWLTTRALPLRLIGEVSLGEAAACEDCPRRP